ncbi:uncharacterized protein LOC108607210 [Drosophila busckii]|uniref:uncharacterized protein LOC108607210 n=1 Tax=Drosophila busckii TaxID=30019 RepID=UPI00083EB8E2|nr:uncharacterized protein LOC108607210 [Drosophila busckii]
MVPQYDNMERQLRRCTARRRPRSRKLKEISTSLGAANCCCQRCVNSSYNLCLLYQCVHLCSERRTSSTRYLAIEVGSRSWRVTDLTGLRTTSVFHSNINSKSCSSCLKGCFYLN